MKEDRAGGSLQQQDSAPTGSTHTCSVVTSLWVSCASLNQMIQEGCNNQMEWWNKQIQNLSYGRAKDKIECVWKILYAVWAGSNCRWLKKWYSVRPSKNLIPHLHLLESFSSVNTHKPIYGTREWKNATVQLTSQWKFQNFPILNDLWYIVCCHLWMPPFSNAPSTPTNYRRLY